MITLLTEIERQLLSQHQQLCSSDAGLDYLRNKSELCAEHAKVYYRSWPCLHLYDYEIPCSVVQSILNGTAVVFTGNIGYNPEIKEQSSTDSHLQTMLDHLLQLANSSDIDGDSEGIQITTDQYMHSD